MRIMRSVSVASLLLICALWLPISVASTRLPEGPTGNPNCSDLRDNDRSGLRDSSDTGCAAAVPFGDCATGKCAEAADGLLVSPIAVVSDTDVDGTVDVIAIPFGQPYGLTKLCFGIDFDLTGYVWLRVKGTGSVWVTMPGDSDHEGQPSNHHMTKVTQSEYGYVPIGQRVDEDYARGAIEGDLPQRVFALDGTPTATQLCIAMTGGMAIRSIYVDASATATPILPTVEEPTAVVNYRMFELGANPAPSVDSAVWNEANSVPWGGDGLNLPLDAPAIMQAVYKEGSPDRICVRWEKTLANQVWLDVATDSTTIVDYTASVFYLKMDSLLPISTEHSWIIATSPQPDYYDANWPGGVFTTGSNLANVAVTASVSGNRRRIQTCFDSPQALVDGQQFLCGFRDHERITAGVKRYQAAFNTGSTLGHLGLCEASGVIVNPADTTNPVVTSTNVDCSTASSCTITVHGTDETSQSMTTTLQVGTSTGSYTLATQGPVGTTGNCITDCTSLFTLNGLSASTTYYVLATMRDQAGNTDAGAQASDTTLAAGVTRWIAPGATGTACTEEAPCPISRLAATSGTYPAPGETWLLKDGTYPIGTRIDCATGSRNGTQNAKITIKAENERKAFIHSTADTTTVFFTIRNCSDYVIEGLRIGAATGTLHKGGLFDVRLSQRITIRRLLLHHSSNLAGASALVIYEGAGGHLVEENECYYISRYCILTKYEMSGTYRNNYARTRNWVADSSAGYNETFKSNADAAMAIYPDQNILIEDQYSEKTVAVVSSETDTTLPVSGDSRILGAISVGDLYGVKPAIHTGAAHRSRNWVIRNLLVVSPTVTGSYLRGVTNAQFFKSSWFMTVANGGPAVIADHEDGKADPGTLSVFVRDSLIHGLAGETEFSVMLPEYDDYGLTDVRMWNNAGSTPTSSAKYVNVTTSDPGMGTAKVCIPTTSNLKGAASDGGDIGADVLYRYINGVKTTQKRWVTTKPASCPANTSGIYPYGMGECIAGINNTVADSFVGIADRLGMTIAQVETTCGAGAGYFP